MSVVGLAVLLALTGLLLFFFAVLLGGLVLAVKHVLFDRRQKEPEQAKSGGEGVWPPPPTRPKD